jgi:hypothetical protein
MILSGLGQGPELAPDGRRDHVGDPGDHDADPGDHDAPIRVITMRRSA